MEEATITVGVTRRIERTGAEFLPTVRRSALSEINNTPPVTRRLGIAEIIAAPVRRAMAMDFFSYFK